MTIYVTFLGNIFNKFGDLSDTFFSARYLHVIHTFHNGETCYRCNP